MDSLNQDKALQTIKECKVASNYTNKILAKFGQITPKLPLVVSHTLFSGPAGTGKTMRVEESAKILGCSESDNTLIKLSPDCLSSIETFVSILSSSLSWQGYLCNYGKTEHSTCPCKNHHIVDPINPRTPVKQVCIFIDEIHVLAKDFQEKLGLIMLDFRYQVPTQNGLKDIFFPKFTLFGATTKPGDLIKPLRTRFGNKFHIDYYSDSEMLTIVNSMLKLRGWSMEEEAKYMVSKASQGVAREAENILTGLFNSWIFALESGQDSNKYAITNKVALKYFRSQKIDPNSGISYRQFQVLNYLNTFKGTGKPVGVGVNRICSNIGIDTEMYNDELEPKLSKKGFIVSGNRGREITEEGSKYVSNTKEYFEGILDS